MANFNVIEIKRLVMLSFAVFIKINFKNEIALVTINKKSYQTNFIC